MDMEGELELSGLMSGEAEVNTAQAVHQLSCGSSEVGGSSFVEVEATNLSASELTLNQTSTALPLEEQAEGDRSTSREEDEEGESEVKTESAIAGGGEWEDILGNGQLMKKVGILFSGIQIISQWDMVLCRCYARGREFPHAQLLSLELKFVPVATSSLVMW